jgi:hypothetical protein
MHRIHGLVDHGGGGGLPVHHEPMAMGGWSARRSGAARSLRGHRSLPRRSRKRGKVDMCSPAMKTRGEAVDFGRAAAGGARRHEVWEAEERNQGADGLR